MYRHFLDVPVFGPNMLQVLRAFLKGTFVVIPVSITLVDCFGYVAKVEGNSMQPVLNPIIDGKSESDYIVLNKWKMRTYRVSRGDIVSLYSPKDPETKLVKRIIGIEGDWIKTLGYRRKFVKVPKGQCWVEGDHHSNSMDSNTFGPVPLGLIHAKATRIVWPKHRWQNLKSIIKSDRKPVKLDDYYYKLVKTWSIVDDDDDEVDD